MSTNDEAPGKLLISAPAKRNVQSNDRIGIACFYCRRRRTKCDGARPRCGKCAAIDMECQYASQRRSRLRELEERFQEIQAAGQTSETDGSPVSPFFSDAPDTVKQACDLDVSKSPEVSPETLSAARDKSQLLQQLFDLIHDGNDTDISSLVQNIRQSSSWRDIEPLVARQSQLQQRAKPSTQPETLASLQNNIPESPRFRVPATPWTTVTDDDLLVSHLLSLFFTWEHPFLNFIDIDLFIQDMANGISQFCSKFLFYAGSLDKPRNRSSENQLMNLFLAEAMNSIENETTTASLTKLQGTLLLTLTFNCIGKDRLGLHCLRSATQMVEDPSFHIYHANLQLTAGFSGAREWNRAYMTALSGFTHWRGVIMHCMRAYVPLSMPTVANSSTIPGLQSCATWLSYSFPGPRLEVFSAAYMDAQSQLSVIAEKTAQYLFGDGGNQVQQDLAAAAGLLQELNQWHSLLDNRFDVTINPNPQNITLQLYYQTLTIDLWKVSYPSHDVNLFLDAAKTAQRDLIELYRSQHGWKTYCTLLVHWLLTGAFNAIDVLDSLSANVPSWNRSLSTCIDGIWHISLITPQSRFLLRCLQIRLSLSANVLASLSVDTKTILKSFDDDVWDANELSQIQSDYPISFNDSSVLSDGGEFDKDSFITAEQLLKTYRLGSSVVRSNPEHGAPS